MIHHRPSFTNKPDARQWVKSQWPLLDWTALSQQTSEHLPAMWHRVQARLGTDFNVLDYASLPGELSLSVVNRVAVNRYWLPKVQGQDLLAGSGTRLIAGAYGIKEPIDNLTDDWASLQPWLLIIPCLALSPQGFRLGRGKGYYDRLLSRLDRQGVVYWSVGVCPSHCLADWPTDEWDLPLNAQLTETGLSELST